MGVLAGSGPEPGAQDRAGLGRKLLWGLSWGVQNPHANRESPRGDGGRQVGVRVAWGLKQESDTGTGDCRLCAIFSHSGCDPESFGMKRFLLQSYSSPKWWQTRGRQVEDALPPRLIPQSLSG
uniref:Uncharacterized protein n=1 Tax=Cyanistes caeruleus TaxID=156563 RepID=A0A8C0U076_CYACU